MADNTVFDLQFKKGILVCTATGEYDVKQVQEILACPNMTPKNGNFIIKTDSKTVYSKIVPSLQELGSVTWNKTPVKTTASISKFFVKFKKNKNLLDMILSSTDKIKIEDAIEFLKTYSKNDSRFVVKNGILYEVDPDSIDQLTELTALANKADNSKENEKEGILHLNLADSLKVSKILNRPTPTEHFIYEMSDEVSDLIKDVSKPFENEYAVPSNLKATPYPYQFDGFKWLCTLNHYGLGCVLADDMGLGKSLQAISLVLHNFNKGEKNPVLIVCPSSLVYNWSNEFKKFAPDLNVQIISGDSNARHKKIQNEESQVFITSYNTLHNDFSLYKTKQLSILIADEAQYIKNPDSLNAQCVKSLWARFKLAISGTPIENKLLDLWSIFDFILPGFLGAQSDFSHNFNSSTDKKNLETLHNKIAPFILRRMKKDVLKDLPEKTEENLYVKMGEEQQTLYNAEVSKLRAIIDKKTDEEFSKEKLFVLSQLTKLRQICCAPELVYDKFAGENSKLSATFDLITNAIEGGHKILIFSQFTQMLDLLANKLDEQQIKYHLLKGDTPPAKRSSMVTSFATDDVPVFCISLKAGGTGLTLTAADIVIHYDPWWNVSSENQASDRAYRIGQKNSVTVYKMVTKGAIEEQIIKIQENKKQLSDTILSGADIANTNLSREDLLELLSEEDL